jgi:hypothetical protein
MEDYRCLVESLLSQLPSRSLGWLILADCDGALYVSGDMASVEEPPQVIADHVWSKHLLR